VAKRQYPPGMHGWRRGKVSDYGVRLREKQKVKRYYGVLETQFRRYFQEAERSTGNTGSRLLVLLERRLDSIIYRLAFAPSRAAARQLILHGHVLIDGRRSNVPSLLLKPGQTITIHESMREQVKQSIEAVGQGDMAEFMERTVDPPEARMTRMPTREDVSLPVEEQLIVEFCSR